MKYTKERAGNFNFSTVVTAFDFDLADLQSEQLLHGLPLQSQYIYGGFHAADGTLYVVERKFAAAMTGGSWFMSNESGDMELLPTAIHTARGELVRTFTPDTRRWTDHLMQKVGKDNAPDAVSFDLFVDNETMKWSEGELVQTEGKLASQAISFFAPMRDEGLMYVSVPYMMKGTIMGKPVEGAMYFDHLYFSHGIEWKEYAWYTDIQVSWNVFHNLFEDGSFEFGHIVQGAQGFSAGMVVDTKRGVTVSNHLDTDYAMDEEDCIAGASYSMKGKIWDFTADKDGRMLQFNKARWAGYRAQSGITRLRGDDRRMANGFTWLECFADRIRAQGWERK